MSGPSKRRLSVAFKGLFGVALAVFSLSSCCIGNNSCCDFGRPPVLCYKSRYIIDYNDCFLEVPIGSEEYCLRALQREPLTANMFDPFEPIDPNYRLARGDILEISVFGEEETAVENAMIAPDGKLYYTVLNGIQAADRRPDEVAKEIQVKLGDLFLHPLVNISLKKSQSLNFRVLGRVKVPGEYPMEGPVTLREAIAEAGGMLYPAQKDQDYGRRYLVPYENLDDSFIARGNRILDVDFKRLLLEGDGSQNIYLRPNDYIYIAPSELKEVFVLGYVGAPQRVPYIPEMTLMSTLGTAGGWPTPSPYSADLDNVLVIRGALECPHVCSVNVNKILCGQATDVRLQPGDIVYASHKHFRFGREMVLLAIEAFVSSFVSSAGEHYTRIHWFDVFSGENSGEESE